MNYIGNALIGVAFQALVIYVVLRLVHGSSDAGTAPMRPARRHAFCAAVIALFASGALGGGPLSRLGSNTTPAGETGAGWSTFGETLVATSVPFAALGGMYILAQFTGPIGGGRLRSADLSVRRLRDYLPARLTIFTAVMVALGGGAIALTAGLGPVDAAGAPRDLPPEAYGFTTVRDDGRFFGAIAGLSYAVFVGVAVLAILVIVRRRRVPTLTHAEDSIIRRVFLNRLLRSAALVAVTVMSGCLEFAAIGPTPEDWNPLRFAVTCLALLTVAVILIARPPVAESEVDQEIPGRNATPGAALPPAARVVRSGRTLGYTAWAVCLLVALFTVGTPPGGSLALAIVVCGYLGLVGAQLFAELALTLNHGTSRRLDPARFRSLPPSLLVPAVPAVVALVAVLSLSLSEGSPRNPSWFVGFGLVLTACIALMVFSAVRPALRAMSDDGDRHLRAASVRRALLLMISSALTLAAFVIADSGYVLPPTSGGDDANPFTYPIRQGELGGFAVALVLAAVVVAALPGPRLRRGVGADVPAEAAR